MCNKSIIKEIEKNSFNKKFKKLKKDISFLNNRYSLEEEVGRGGLSIVYKATDIYCKYFKEDSNIVIKIPTEELLEKNDISAFVYAEYSFLRKLNHNNIVKVLDFGIDKKSEIPYIVLEHIEGILLDEFNISDMNKEFKQKIFKTLSQTIKYIHNQNIVHADITPSNILIKNDKPILFDFGISQDIDENKKFNLEYKKVKAFNPKYSAPEVLAGESPTIASDIFSFASIMFELFTNEELFENSSIELNNLTFLKEKLKKLPHFLRPWFKKSLSIEKKERVYPYNSLNYLFF